MPMAKRKTSKRVSRKRKRSVGRRRPMRRTRLQIEDDGGLALVQEVNRIIHESDLYDNNFQNNLYGFPMSEINSVIDSTRESLEKTEQYKKDVDTYKKRAESIQKDCVDCQLKLKEKHSELIDIESKLGRLDNNRD